MRHATARHRRPRASHLTLASLGWLLAATGLLSAADVSDPGAPSLQNADNASAFDHEHAIADAAMASTDPDAMGRVLDSSAQHDESVGGGGDVAGDAMAPASPGIVGGTLGGTLAPEDDGHGTTTQGFGTSPQGFGTTGHGFGSSPQGFGSSPDGFGGTPSRPGSGAYTDPSVDYGHHLQPVPGENAPAPSAQRP